LDIYENKEGRRLSLIENESEMSSINRFEFESKYKSGTELQSWSLDHAQMSARAPPNDE
jgi:hypothetical protein